MATSIHKVASKNQIEKHWTAVVAVAVAVVAVVAVAVVAVAVVAVAVVAVAAVAVSCSANLRERHVQTVVVRHGAND